MPMLSLLEREGGSPDFNLLGQGIREIGACMHDPLRRPDPALLARLTPRVEVIDARAEVEAELLGALLSADDTEVEAALDVWGASLVVDDGLGTLSEPLKRAASSGRVLMKGELEPGLLGDLIQLFAQNKETGRLVVDGPGGEGCADFRQGAIVDAAFGSLQGEPAFIELVAVTRGRFFWQRGIEPRRQTIERSTAHLLMDALRMLDERAAAGTGSRQR